MEIEASVLESAKRHINNQFSSLVEYYGNVEDEEAAALSNSAWTLEQVVTALLLGETITVIEDRETDPCDDCKSAYRCEGCPFNKE